MVKRAELIKSKAGTRASRTRRAAAKRNGARRRRPRNDGLLNLQSLSIRGRVNYSEAADVQRVLKQSQMRIWAYCGESGHGVSSASPLQSAPHSLPCSCQHSPSAAPPPPASPGAGGVSIVRQMLSRLATLVRGELSQDRGAAAGLLPSARGSKWHLVSVSRLGATGGRHRRILLPSERQQ
ncbi:hypothetical protein AAFF_G00163630 [Aldrovandia affinis]|uniref:Uncharacterized protein n=1 Tax=Aldrovandia affinis TaxID=143900 RepID=A0AAD7WWG4_9TELE|nr:hypothetical protein AAFF_G00163630 [Aldrovandia affinis]